jgi:hypothetical protein
MKFIPTAATLLVVVFGMCDRPSNAQVDPTHAFASGRSIVATNTTPQLREIGANYFAPLKQSQVWMNVEPELSDSDPVPVMLNVTVVLPGLRLNQAPATVQVRAESICTAFPLRIRQPILRFVVTRTTTINLTGTGSTYQFVSHCSKKGPLDAIVADLPFDSLRQIAQATDVTVDALGFSLRLASADLAAWRVFVHTVEGGVTVRPK